MPSPSPLLVDNTNIRNNITKHNRIPAIRRRIRSFSVGGPNREIISVNNEIPIARLEGDVPGSGNSAGESVRSGDRVPERCHGAVVDDEVSVFLHEELDVAVEDYDWGCGCVP